MPANMARAFLQDLCILVTDGTHDSPKLQPDGVPFVKGKHISGGFIDFDNCDYITYEDHLRVIERSKPERGDILFSNIGSVGDTAFVNVDFEFSIKNVALFKPDPSKVAPRYLYYYVSSSRFKDGILRRRSGVAQPFISLDNLRSYEIDYHEDLTIQRKIAAILSAYDDLIENNTRRIAVLEEMARLLYREWFVHFRFPGHEQVAMVDSELGPIPEGWEALKVTEAVHVNPRMKVPKEGLKPYVPMKSLSETSMLIEDVESRSGNSGSKFKNGDTLFARITPCLENGKTGFVQFLPSDTIGLGSTEFIVLRSKTLSPEYVYLMARSDEFRDHAIKSMTGATGRQRVQVVCFDEFFIAHPDPETLRRFVDQVSPMFQSIHLLVEKNQNLRRTRDLLLPRLISGEVDVSEIQT
jgi:type I restriction enzyme S subunit